MRTIKVKEGQSLLDIAIEHCGDVSAAPLIAEINAYAYVNDKPDTGADLIIPDIINKHIVNNFTQRGVSPASFDDSTTL